MKLIRAPRRERFPVTEYDIECPVGACEAIYRCLGSELKELADYQYEFKCPSCGQEIELEVEDLDECEVKVQTKLPQGWSNLGVSIMPCSSENK